MNMKKLLSTIIIGLFLACTSFADCGFPIATLYGRVTDVDTGSGIMSARLTAYMLPQNEVCATTLTSGFGYYSMTSALAHGDYIVTASAKGYQTQAQLADVLGDTELDFALSR